MGRTPCCDKNGQRKGPWAPDEDMRLIQYIQKHGPRNWRTLPNNAGLQRCGKSCRLRWINYLRPDIKRGRFSFEEEETIIQLHNNLGNKWSAIAARLPGRTDNEIKNFWNTHIRKRLVRSGIDPVTHAPRLDLLGLSTILNSPQPNPFLGKINLSNLIILQALLNPEALKLALSLFSSNINPNPDVLLQKLQENNHNLFSNSQNQPPMVLPIQHDKTLPQKTLLGETIDYCVQSTGTSNHQVLLENDMTSNTINTSESLPNTFPSFCYEPITTESSEKSGFQSPVNNSKNSSFDSILSTHIEDRFRNLDSASMGLITKEKTDDDKECFLSSLLMFKIPESLEFDDFM